MTNWKYASVVLSILSLSATTALNAQTFNIFPTHPVAPATSSASLLNIETPFRCQTDDIKNQKVVTTLPVTAADFKLVNTDEIDALPRYEVNGFSFGSMPLDEALQLLVEEAGISVYTEDEAYVDLNAKDIYGELDSVINELTKAGDTYYKYDNATKRLYISRHGRFDIKLPNNRLVVLGVLDALRGAGIENATPNWNTGAISVTLTREEEEKVKDLLSRIVSDGQMLLADTQVYTIAPISAGANWGNVIQQFGIDKVYTANTGLMGKLLSMGHQKKASDLISTLQSFYQITPISQGMAIVPNGWKMRFDIGKCAANAYSGTSLSLLLNPRIKKDGVIDSQVTLDTTAGELSTFKVNTAVDNELAIIGIPDQLTGTASELFVVLKLKLIRLVGDNR